MSFESIPRQVSEIDLRDYTNYVRIYDECRLFDCAIDYVETQRSEQKFENHMTDVVYRAADFVEPRFDGKVLDEQKRGTSAFIDGGVLAATIIKIAGGESLLSSLELDISSPTSYDDIDEATWLRRKTEIWDLGLHSFYRQEATFMAYRELIEDWEKELVAPEDATFLHAGFGLVMHLADKAIQRQVEICALNEAYLRPTQPQE